MGFPNYHRNKICSFHSRWLNQSPIKKNHIKWNWGRIIWMNYPSSCIYLSSRIFYWLNIILFSEKSDIKWWKIWIKARYWANRPTITVPAASKEFLYETQKSLQQAWHQPVTNKFVWRKSNWMFAASNNLPSNSVVSLQKQNAARNIAWTSLWNYMEWLKISQFLIKTST